MWRSLSYYSICKKSLISSCDNILAIIKDLTDYHGRPMDISNKNVVRSLRGALNSIFVNTKFMKIEGLVHENKKA